MKIKEDRLNRADINGQETLEDGNRRAEKRQSLPDEWRSPSPGLQDRSMKF